MHAFAGGFENRACKCDGRTFAVGAGDVDDRRQMPFRMAERRQQALDAIERQVDALGMQRQQTRMDGANRGSARTRRVHAGAGRLKRGFVASAGAFSNSRQSRAIMPRIS